MTYDELLAHAGNLEGERIILTAKVQAMLEIVETLLPNADEKQGFHSRVEALAARKLVARIEELKRDGNERAAKILMSGLESHFRG